MELNNYEHQNKLIYKTNNCAICISNIKNSKKKTLYCGHQFHDKCINILLKNLNKCPLCQKNIYDCDISKLNSNIKWFKIYSESIYDDYYKYLKKDLFCHISNKNEMNDTLNNYEIRNIFFNDTIKHYDIYHPEYKYGFMIDTTQLKYNDYIGLFENNILISCFCYK